MGSTLVIESMQKFQSNSNAVFQIFLFFNCETLLTVVLLGVTVTSLFNKSNHDTIVEQNSVISPAQMLG